MGSIEKTASHSHSNQVLQQEPCCSKPKWLLVAFSIGGVVGILFISLSALQVFGASGSIGFIASIAGGGGLTVVSLGGGLWVVARGYSGQASVVRKISSDYASDSETSSDTVEQKRPAKKPMRGNPKDPRQQEIVDAKLHSAISFGDVASIDAYIRQGANVNGRDARWGQTPLYHAVSRGHLDTVKLLIEQDEIDLEAEHADKKTALHQAVELGYKDMAEALIYAGANVNAKAADNATPLHLAAQGTHLEIVQFLVNRNEVNIEARNSWGNTSLLAAFNANRFEIAQFLHIEAHADLMATNRSKSTALHFAAQNDNIGAIGYLLENGFDINVKDAEGRTPLHYAASSQTGIAYQYLLEKGAKDCADKSGAPAALIRNQTPHFI